MTSRDFCYWLQGFFEINGNHHSLVLNNENLNVIKNHLNLVFKHEIDPSFKLDKDTEIKYQHIHDGKVDSNNLNKSDVVMRC